MLLVCLRISLWVLNVQRAFHGNLDAYDFKTRAYLQVGTSRFSSACYAFKSRDLEKARLYLRTFTLFRISKSSISHWNTFRAKLAPHNEQTCNDIVYFVVIGNCAACIDLYSGDRTLWIRVSCCTFLHHIKKRIYILTEVIGYLTSLHRSRPTGVPRRSLSHLPNAFLEILCVSLTLILSSWRLQLRWYSNYSTRQKITKSKFDSR